MGDETDLLVRECKIVRIASGLSHDGFVIEGKGKIVAPSFCDTHVHFRTPGQTHKEDIFTGSASALAGGFTTVLQMPNTNPAIDSPELVRDLTRDEPIELRVIAAITKGISSGELNDLHSLLDAGAVGFSDDGKPVTDPALMKKALEFSKSHGIPIVSHSEDLSIGAQGSVRAGWIAEKLGLDGWDPAREYAMVERDCELAKITGGHLHVCHVSTKESVEIIRRAKSEGVKVSSEVTPHHISLVSEDVIKLGANAKMNPPLGTPEDREALIGALCDGTIDCIASDHAPHTEMEKMASLAEAPFGVIGLETSFSVCHTELVIKRDAISLEKLVGLISKRPREIFSLHAIEIREGSGANFVLIDPDLHWRPDVRSFKSKGRNCPFDGMPLTGKVVLTVYKGRIAYRHE
ncbi:MAG: dihydroorotase [bacterium]